MSHRQNGCTGAWEEYRGFRRCADCKGLMDPIAPKTPAQRTAERPDWHTYFLGIAEAVAARADCTRSKVGAVLVNARNEVRGTGYNGAPSGIPGCASAGACPRGKLSADECVPNSDYANCIADHAERNALRHTATGELTGATLYSTRAPCPSCWTLIRAAGLHMVVTPDRLWILS